MHLVRIIDDFEEPSLAVKIFSGGFNAEIGQQGWFEVELGNKIIIDGMFVMEDSIDISHDEFSVALLRHLSLMPGEIGGPEYDEYNEEQEEFIKKYGEMFGLYANDLEFGV
jgi:hypothetical protein